MLREFAHGGIVLGRIALDVQQLVKGHLAKVGVFFADDVAFRLVGGEQVLECPVAGRLGGDLHEVMSDVVANGFLLKDDFVLAKRKVEAASEQLHVEERPAEEPRANDVGKDDADEHGFG